MRRRFVLTAALALAALALALAMTPRSRALAQAAPADGNEAWRDDLARLAIEIQDQVDADERLRDDSGKLDRARAELDEAKKAVEVAREKLAQSPATAEQAKAERVAAEAALGRAREKLAIVAQGLKQRPDDPVLLVLRVDLRAELERAEATLEDAERAEKIARLEGDLDQQKLKFEIRSAEAALAEKKATLEQAEADGKRREAEWKLRETQARRPIEAIREAFVLEFQWRTARLGHLPADVVKGIESEVRSKLAEAQRRWRDVRLNRAQERIGFAH